MKLYLTNLGSVIVDMAVSQGGNCASSELNKVIDKNGCANVVMYI